MSTLGNIVNLGVNALRAQQVGLSDARGLVVTSIDSNSPAERAGFLPRDVIATIEGEPVRSNEDVRDRLVDKRAGDSVRLGVVRGGEALDLTMTLGDAR